MSLLPLSVYFCISNLRELTWSPLTFVSSRFLMPWIFSSSSLESNLFSSSGILDRPLLRSFLSSSISLSYFCNFEFSFLSLFSRCIILSERTPLDLTSSSVFKLLLLVCYDIIASKSLLISLGIVLLTSSLILLPTSPTLCTYLEFMWATYCSSFSIRKIV
jgi:hypothetical protein